VRATAESGWDFSSRWMRDNSDLRTLETTKIIPIDLNCLLFQAEQTLSKLHRLRGRRLDLAAAEKYSTAADRRKEALLTLSFDKKSGFFYDAYWPSGERIINRPTLAAVYPLFLGIASLEQAHAVAARLEREFLKKGGFVTTTVISGQQWDAPNGWAPLQWLAISGLRRYGELDIANKARDRWLALNRQVYFDTGKMMEKYDVLDPGRKASGGEYPAADGFGWTNGVALALESEKTHRVN
jgi:alpha,alpha-trehalase